MEVPHEKKAVLALMQKLSSGRAFVSMPVTPLTPKWFWEHPAVSDAKTKEGVERRHGILKFDECALSPFDHGGLYGDGVFEGILIKHEQVYKLRDHLERLERSARGIGLELPYSKSQFASHLIETAREAGITSKQTAYVRLVVTRGIGNLGIDPRKCLAPTVYIIVYEIALYPKKNYQTGIHLSVAKNVRRPDKSVLDPTVKSLNYLNNIQAVREGVIDNPDKTVMEVLELTHRGYVAEASADNLFIVDKSGKKPVLLTAADDYALEGITRASIISWAKKSGIEVVKSSTLLPEDLLGNKEVFLTGTAAGVIPVVKFDGKKIGTGRPGPMTKRFMAMHAKDQKNPRSGLSLKASKHQISSYLSSRLLLPHQRAHAPQSDPP
ncbi:MAG TPA: aminotransferase class IV [Candidatus Nanoarchaeia archaeon]|nr:aminotransferase class IV [Candidatus Nanoarchaeia archaeon]